MHLSLRQKGALHLDTSRLRLPRRTGDTQREANGRPGMRASRRACTSTCRMSSHLWSETN